MHVSIILNIILFIRILPNGYILVGKIGNWLQYLIVFSFLNLDWDESEILLTLGILEATYNIYLYEIYIYINLNL